MNLIIDQGNTSVKLAVISEGRLIERFVENDLTVKVLEKILKDYPGIKKAILSSVAEYGNEVPEFLYSSLERFIQLDHRTPVPIINNYRSKETLGLDRLAAAVGAYTIFPATNVLVVDAGTAITFDLVSAKGEYRGGNISPGLDLRFKALHTFTKKLPLVEKADTFSLLGDNTHDAILAGVLNGVVFETDSYINELRTLYPDLKVVLTGGDINFFVRKLKNIIFVDANLVVTGLNRILEFNDK